MVLAKRAVVKCKRLELPLWEYYKMKESGDMKEFKKVMAERERIKTLSSEIGSTIKEYLDKFNELPPDKFKKWKEGKLLRITEARALREQRDAICDLGHVRTPFVRDDGSVNYRCPAEPVRIYERKGGESSEADGRVCLCNALTATVGLGQTRKDGTVELPLVTLGDDLSGPRVLLETHPLGWSAAQAIEWLRGASVDA